MFWTANAANPREQITQETLLNGVVSNRAFDAVTGWVKTIQSGVGGGTGVQNLEYAWDKLGNLSSRIDKNQSNLTEAFFYDNLYRLDYSQRNGVTNQDLSYDALGNVMSKLDVGSYTYHATKKHQVMSTGSATTRYIRGLMEKVTTSSGSDYRSDMILISTIFRSSAETRVFSSRSSKTSAFVMPCFASSRVNSRSFSRPATYFEIARS